MDLLIMIQSIWRNLTTATLPRPGRDRYPPKKSRNKKHLRKVSTSPHFILFTALLLLALYQLGTAKSLLYCLIQ